MATAAPSYLESRSSSQELMTRGMAAEREFITSTTELHQVTQSVLDKCILRDEVLKVRIDYLERSLAQQTEAVQKVEKTAKKAKRGAAQRARGAANKTPKQPDLVPAIVDQPRTSPDRLQFRQHQPAYGE